MSEENSEMLVMGIIVEIGTGQGMHVRHRLNGREAGKITDGALWVAQDCKICEIDSDIRRKCSYIALNVLNVDYFCDEH